MSDGTRTRVSYVREVTGGTTPASPEFKELRIVRTGLTFRPITVTSEEMAADRQRKDVIRVGIEAGGTVELEWSWANMDDLLESVFFNLWTLTPIRFNNAADQNITDITAGTGVITIATATGTKINSGTFAVGHLVRASGETTNAGNNFLKRVTAAGAGSITVATAGLVTNAAPNLGYRLKAVGVEAPAAANIQATTAGLGAGAAGAITLTGVDALAAGFVPGMWFKASAFATGNNNGWYRALTVVAGRIECDIVPTGFATDTAAGVQVRLWFGDYLRNGTTKLYHTLEQHYQDLADDEFDYLAGSLASRWDISLSQQAIVRNTIEFVSFGATNGVSRFAAASDDVLDEQGAIPRTGEIFNTSGDVARIGENGAAIGGPNYALDFGLTINNNIRRQNAIGTLSSIGLGAGQCEVSGNINTYYGSNAIRTRLLNGTASSVDLALDDPAAARRHIIDMPRVKFSDGNPEGNQNATDRTMNAAYVGLKHPTFGYTIQLQRVEEYE